jgi:DNA-directed RNA polymerase specialized sigma24 family protein
MSTREVVVKLAREGWNSEEIARTTKLSRGEVELILELTPNE